MFVESDAVRVVTLVGSPMDHLIIATVERTPRVGDVGMVVDVSDRLGGIGQHYTVALRHPDARLIWLAVFMAHELELVG